MAKYNFMKDALGAVAAGIQAKADQENAKNNFMASMVTHGLQQKMEMEQKKALFPMELEQKRQLAQIEGESKFTPLDKLRYQRQLRYEQQYGPGSQPQQAPTMQEEPVGIPVGEPQARPVGVMDIQNSIRQRKQEPPRMIVDVQMDSNGDYVEKKIENPDWKAWRDEQKEYNKPLSGDAATKYSSSLRALDQLKKISTELNRDEYLKDPESRVDIIKKANQFFNAATAKDTMVPMAKGIYERNMRNTAGDKGARIGQYFLNLAESQLRAESGAAVTDSEMLRQRARTLFSNWSQSPETWNEMASTAWDFAQRTAQSLRPTHEKEWGGEYTPIQTKNEVAEPSINVEVLSTKFSPEQVAEYRRLRGI